MLNSTSFVFVCFFVVNSPKSMLNQEDIYKRKYREEWSPSEIYM